MHGSVTPPWMQTGSGAAYAIGTSDCLAGSLDLEQDVAVPLSRICRYLGHTTQPWSVAAHAVCCANFAKRMGWDARTQLAALHHDDHEALMGDFLAPVKWWLKQNGAGPALKELEQQSQAAVMRVTGVGGHGSTVSAAVKRADMAMLMGEAAVLMLEPPLPWGIEIDEQDVRLATEIVSEYLMAPIDGFDHEAAEAYLVIDAEIRKAIAP